MEGGACGCGRRHLRFVAMTQGNVTPAAQQTRYADWRRTRVAVVPPVPPRVEGNRVCATRVVLRQGAQGARWLPVGSAFALASGSDVNTAVTAAATRRDRTSVFPFLATGSRAGVADIDDALAGATAGGRPVVLASAIIAAAAFEVAGRCEARHAAACVVLDRHGCTNRKKEEIAGGLHQFPGPSAICA